MLRACNAKVIFVYVRRVITKFFGKIPTIPSMKREFILAAGLLALGCLLFLNRNDANNLEVAADTTIELHDSQTVGQSNVGFASFQQTSENPASSPESGAQSNTQRTRQNDVSGSISALNLIESATNKLLSSPPISAKAKLNVNLFNTSTTATGVYLQANQGTGMSRMELEFDGPNETIKFVQLCDGRFNYQFQGSSELSEGQLNFVDLHRISEACESNPGFTAQPTDWFADGSLPRMLLNLSQAFDWTDPVTTQLSNAKMIRIDGSWRADRLSECLEGQVDSSWLQPAIQWDKLPGHLPQVVHIYFAADGPVKLFPHRIDFIRPTTKQATHTMLSLELYEVTKREHPFPQKLFTVNATTPEAIDMIDETEEYVARVAQLQQNALVRRQTKTRQDSIDRTAQNRSPVSQGQGREQK